ncbi:MAG TPA: TolC family protein [Candidatus Polarisedimenticolia bacterium]|nr:TolC family protein [Candidatus Polarisedimenticolia bacterium]
MICAAGILALTLLAAAAPPVPSGAQSSPALAKARERGSLTLMDSFVLAAAYNERVERVREDLDQARLLRKSAIAEVLPDLTLNDDYYRQNPVNITDAGNVFSVAEWRNETRVTLTQPIFHGLRDRSFLKYSESNLESNRYRVEEARRLIYGAVAESFYGALQVQGQMRALQDTVELERERLREVEARHEAGLARRTEVLLVKSELEQDESNLIRATNQLQGTRFQLAFWTTAPVELPLEDDLFLPDVPVPPPGTAGQEEMLGAMMAVARANRSDLRAADKAVEAAEYQVSTARGEFFPAIDFEGNYYLSRKNYSTFAEETDWSAQIFFTVPLFDGGRIRANVLTAKSQMRQASLQRDELLRQVELDVQNAYLTLQSDLATLGTLQASVTAAEENNNLVNEEYRRGLATNLEVVTGGNQLLSARLNQEHQKYQVRLDYVLLKLVQGLVPEGAQPDPWIGPAPDSSQKGEP